MIKDLSVIFVLGLVFFIIDIKTFKYCTTDVYPILLLHHVVNIFAQFGFLCTDKNLLLIYLFTPILVMLHWKTNKNKCILTQMVNKQCGYKHMYFRDIWFLLGFKNIPNYGQLHYIYLSFAWFVGLLRFLKA
jgi:hypothetical protein